jgi:predicted CoA-substrate-specific enzyme activase
MSGRAYVGIDAGSSATKCVALDAGGRLVARSAVPSGFDYTEASKASLQGAGIEPGQIAACVATGYGRERVPWANRRITEITCHARGAYQWYPQARAIVDIGGQDTKIIRLSAHGRTADYRMNAKCAAGTGTFLESIAVRLALPLSVISELALTSTSRLTLNSYCTVFTTTEVLERIKEGQPKQDIAMGLFRAIASRVVEMMPGRDGPVAATGGVVAHCAAMVRALEEALQAPVLLPPLPQHAGAYGAALLALAPHEQESPPRAPSPRTLSLEVRPC